MGPDRMTCGGDAEETGASAQTGKEWPQTQPPGSGPSSAWTDLLCAARQPYPSLGLSLLSCKMGQSFSLIGGEEGLGANKRDFSFF